MDELEVRRIQGAAEWLATVVKTVSGTAQIATAAYSGGVGKLTVSPQGRLLSVELNPAASSLRSDRLAAAIEGAYAVACADAVAQTRDLIARVRAEHPDLGGLFDDMDREFADLATALHAPPRPVDDVQLKSAADPPRDGPLFDEGEWDPAVDPLGRRGR